MKKRADCLELFLKTEKKNAISFAERGEISICCLVQLQFLIPLFAGEGKCKVAKGGGEGGGGCRGRVGVSLFCNRTNEGASKMRRQQEEN